jgi:Arc/MetJ-type ribon-helix-helix transcriptional regulator
MKQINIRMTPELRDQIDDRADDLGFSSRAEYVRFVVRQDLQAGRTETNDA